MPRICLVQLHASDMDTPLDFYAGTLGFSVASRELYPEIVKLRHEALPIVLYRVEAVSALPYRSAGQTIINIETDDLQRELDRLLALGVEVIHHTPVPCPVGVYAGIRDPFGNILELLEYTSPLWNQ